MNTVNKPFRKKDAMQLVTGPTTPSTANASSYLRFKPSNSAYVLV